MRYRARFCRVRPVSSDSSAMTLSSQAKPVAVPRIGRGSGTGPLDRGPGGLVPRKERAGPPAHPPEPAYPCCLPALGELAR